MSVDGNRLIPEGSTCPDGNSLAFNLRGFSVFGIPCDVSVRSKREVPINPVSLTFYFVETTEDPTPCLDILSTACVWGQSKDSVLLDAGGAVTIRDAQGVCPGGWLDATPAP